MLKVVKSPLIRSLAALALIGGVGFWNYKSTAQASCWSVCFKSNHVWVKYRTPCVSGHRLLCGAYNLVSYPDGAHSCAGKRIPTCIFWLGKCPSFSLCVVRGSFRPTVCVAFYCPVGRCCPCSGCCLRFCCKFCDLSNAASIALPTTCPVYWIQTCHGLCESAG
jgi:hypothetical protein